jgi:hypothetical protein
VGYLGGTGNWEAIVRVLGKIRGLDWRIWLLRESLLGEGRWSLDLVN